MQRVLQYAIFYIIASFDGVALAWPRLTVCKYCRVITIKYVFYQLGSKVLVYVFIFLLALTDVVVRPVTFWELEYLFSLGLGWLVKRGAHVGVENGFFGVCDWQESYDIIFHFYKAFLAFFPKILWSYTHRYCYVLRHNKMNFIIFIFKWL